MRLSVALVVAAAALITADAAKINNKRRLGNTNKHRNNNNKHNAAEQRHLSSSSGKGKGSSGGGVVQGSALTRAENDGLNRQQICAAGQARSSMMELVFPDQMTGTTGKGKAGKAGKAGSKGRRVLRAGTKTDADTPRRLCIQNFSDTSSGKAGKAKGKGSRRERELKSGKGKGSSDDEAALTRADSDCIDSDEITNYTPDINCIEYCGCMCNNDLAEDAALNYADLVMNYSGSATGSGKAGKAGKAGKNGSRERELSSGKGKGGKGYDSGNRFADAALVAIMARATDVAYGQCNCQPCEAPVIKPVIDNYAPSAGDTQEVVIIMPNPVTPAPTVLVEEAQVVVPVTPAPTPKPSFSPTKTPTERPTFNPTKSPTKKPTPGPTPVPTTSPTKKPSLAPTPGPTPRPSNTPTPQPTKKPTNSPTVVPTKSPTAAPTPGPTPPPSPGPTPLPTPGPTKPPTPPPTPGPTPPPTPGPTPPPSKTPTMRPSPPPSPQPTSAPTPGPTPPPTPGPTPPPTPGPTPPPTPGPTTSPTAAPSPFPTPGPTELLLGDSLQQETCVKSHPSFPAGSYDSLAGWSVMITADTTINCDNTKIWDLGWPDDGAFDALVLIRNGVEIERWGQACPVNYPVKAGDYLVFFVDNSHEYRGFRICTRSVNGLHPTPPPPGVIQGDCFVSHPEYNTTVPTYYDNFYGYSFTVQKAGRLATYDFNIRGDKTGQALTLWRNGQVVKKWQGIDGPSGTDLQVNDVITWFVDDSKIYEDNTGFKVCMLPP